MIFFAHHNPLTPIESNLYEKPWGVSGFFLLQRSTLQTYTKRFDAPPASNGALWQIFREVMT